MSDDTKALPFEEDNPFSTPEPSMPLERTGGLYPLALPGELVAELGKVAKEQGKTVSSLIIESLSTIIQTHREKKR